jgi:hypothetical protein
MLWSEKRPRKLGALLMLVTTVSIAIAQVELGCRQAGSNPDHSAGSRDAGPSDYDKVVLSDRPVAYWRIDAERGTEPDLTGNGNTGTYANTSPAAARMPNGDPAGDFNGSNQYLTLKCRVFHPDHPKSHLGSLDSARCPSVSQRKPQGRIRGLYG